jgi:hypothetical protein
MASDFSVAETKILMAGQFWFQVDFDSPRTVSEVQLMFQGGFAGKNCRILISGQGPEFKDHAEFYPEDSNKLQLFPVDPVTCSSLKIVFGESTDFYGRITVYQLRLK